MFWPYNQKGNGDHGIPQVHCLLKGWVNEKTRKDRLEYATVMLQRYPNPQDWYRVRISDEVHFGYGR